MPDLPPGASGRGEQLGGDLCRVLMFQDGVALTPAVHRGLELERFAVDVVRHEAQALQFARDNDYHVIVLYLTQRQTDGYRVCGALRAAGSQAPVLILRQPAGIPGPKDVFDVGADDYLTTPIAFVERLARLRTLIRRSVPPTRVILQAGDLTLDPFRHTAERAGTRLQLTPREFSLLHFLIRNRGRILTKQQILNDVWQAEWDGGPNIVEAYISYLRKKVDKPFGRASIETVHGLGYRLRD